MEPFKDPRDDRSPPNNSFIPIPWLSSKALWIDLGTSLRRRTTLIVSDKIAIIADETSLDDLIRYCTRPAYEVV